MRAGLYSVLLALCLAGCGSLPATQQTPYLPPGVFGAYQDNDVGGVNFAAWAFASPANTRNNPVAGAKAIVALEYLPGELRENPRWIRMDAAIPYRLGQARDEAERILGIAPNAPRQLIVNALLAVAWNFQTGNRAGAMQALASPVFTFPPEQTLAILSNLPYMKRANLWSSRAEDQLYTPGGPWS
ncbi:MAG TPA: hypothetical protein VHO91_24185 [Rhodopila sp.]|nr:hypothetical protein [Rhodopila sp.]